VTKKERLPGSFAFWPQVPVIKSRERTLALTGRSGQLQIGSKRIRVESWEEFKALLEERNLEVFAPPLLGWRWWQDAAEDEAAFLILGKAAAPRAIVVQGRRRRFWVTDAAVWNRKPDPSLLRDLEILGKVTGVGVWSTPARTGDAMQRRAWREEGHWKVESRPNEHGRSLLLEGGVGGRGQTMIPGSLSPGCWEIDQRDAYGAAWALPKPHGRAMLTHDATRVRPGEVTAFGPVKWTITEPLSCPGPLPIRGEDGNLAWPTDPGVYFSHAWHEECEDARACGIAVEPTGDGISFASWVSSDLWTQRTSEARRNAGGWGNLLKLCTVAAIGRHGRKPVAWTLVDHPGEGDVGFSPTSDRMWGQRPTDLPSMTHWYSYAVMQARRRVWHRAVAEQWAGRRIVAIETDSLVMDGPPMGPVVRRGDDLPGDWSIRRIEQDCYTPLTRWAIFSDGTGRTPGLPADLRGAWLEENPPPGPSG
jgi:hypothetical protein